MVKTAIRHRARERAQGGGPNAHGDEQLLYEAHHQRLLRSVGWAIHGDRTLVEDACARAWEHLLVSQPERGEHLFAWLRTVAIHEAWALARKERREAEPAHPDGDWLDEHQPALVDSTESAVEARLALAALAGLRERERRYMALRVAGYSYQEICARCGVTYTNVNTHLTRARAKLRALAAEAEAPVDERNAGVRPGTVGGRDR